MTRDVCPICEPEVDPLVELVIEAWCHRHRPDMEGNADSAVPRESRPEGGCDYFGTAYDVEGAENRARCDLIHRGQGGPPP